MQQQELHTYPKNPNEAFHVVTPKSLHTGNCFGISLRNRTVHTVVIVLELHMDYITLIGDESSSE